MTGEKCLQVRYAPMIDIGVGLLHSPYLWVEAEMCLHVLMYQLLKINADCSVSADDHISADAEMFRHITHRVVNFAIAAIVDDKMLGSLQRCGHQPVFERSRMGER